MKDIIGIQRGSIFSPNHVGNDGAIFNAVTDILKDKGLNITILSEEEFRANTNINASAIYGMPRDKETIASLQKLEKRGVKVINSSFGIENCFRSNMTRILIKNNVPYPKSYILPTNINANEAFLNIDTVYYWIKRGDFHAIDRGDVSFVHNLEEGEALLKEYIDRGIDEVVISEHLVGDLVKFYGVVDSDFFYWFYPADANHSKFGHEKINGNASLFSFSEEQLKNIGDKAAKALNIHIYGGDAIIDKNGNMCIIDLNDWPSFAPCRDKAAPNIANTIYNYITKK